jgi:ABC-type Fe3+-hydroxamate transport system substrate-binding protein
MGKTRLAAVIGAVLAIAASGCGSTTDKEKKTAAFPVTVKAANGNVRIAKRPTRIVSISATATEDLFAVGAGPQVKAVDDFSNYPANAPRTKLSGYQPNPEAIAGYRPDLVVVTDNTNHVVDSLEKLGVPVLLNPPAKDLADAYAQLEQLGAATGHGDRAGAVVARMRDRVASITKQAADAGSSLSVYHELDSTFYSATSKTFIGSVYKLLGLHNIADKAAKGGPYPKLSGEYVVKSDPDLIVLADTVCCAQKPATVRKRPGFAGVAAVRDGNVVPVADDLASHWGPRIVDFLALIAKRVDAMRARQ